MGNFAFARAAWPVIAEEAQRAEHYTYGDPRSSIFYARRTIETLRRFRTVGLIVFYTAKVGWS